MARIARLQERVGEHLAERGREVQGKSRFRARRVQGREDLKQRQVDFGDGFVEPVFLQKLGVFWVAHEGQVRVEDETEKSVRHLVGGVSDAGIRLRPRGRRVRSRFVARGFLRHHRDWVAG